MKLKKNTMILNVLLSIVLGAGLLTGMIWRAIQPNVVLPKLDLTAMAALILTALLLEYLLTGSKKRAWGLQTVLAAVTFLILPWAASLNGAGIKTALCGTVLFVILTRMFDWTTERTELMGNGKAAVTAAAFGLYLACQCLMGMI